MKHRDTAKCTGFSIVLAALLRSCSSFEAHNQSVLWFLANLLFFVIPGEVTSRWLLSLTIGTSRTVRSGCIEQICTLSLLKLLQIVLHWMTLLDEKLRPSKCKKPESFLCKEFPHGKKNVFDWQFVLHKKNSLLVNFVTLKCWKNAL